MIETTPTHAVLRIRRHGDKPQNTLFIVNYNKDDLEYYYRTLRYLERLNEEEEDEQEEEEEEEEEEQDGEEEAGVEQNEIALPAAQNMDGSTVLAITVGGYIGMYLFLLLLWVGRYVSVPPRNYDGEL